MWWGGVKSELNPTSRNREWKSPPKYLENATIKGLLQNYRFFGSWEESDPIPGGIHAKNVIPDRRLLPLITAIWQTWSLRFCFSRPKILPFGHYNTETQHLIRLGRMSTEVSTIDSWGPWEESDPQWSPWEGSDPRWSPWEESIPRWSP